MTTTDQDEEIKRRVSIAMRGSAIPVNARPPPADLLARTKRPLGPYNAHAQVEQDEDTKRRTSFVSRATFPLSKASPPSLQTASSVPATVSKGESQIEKDKASKRRASAVVQEVAMRPMEPAAMAIPPKQLIVPSPNKNSSTKSSPSFLSTVDASAPTIQGNLPTKRRMAFSWSQGTERLVPPSPSPSSDLLQDKNQSPLSSNPSPIPPSSDSLVLPSPASSTASRESISVAVAFPKARSTPNNSPQKPSSRSLPLLPFAGDMEYRGLGDRKHRVSLPLHRPSGPHRQLGRRKQRVSLPAAQTTMHADSDSETEQRYVKRRLGKQRVSLPPSMSSSTASQTNRQRASMPPSIPSQQRTNAPMQRRLGERKSNRLSLPNNSASLDHMVTRRPSGSSFCSNEEDSVMVDSDMSSSSNDDLPKSDLPQKGLRRNSGNDLLPPTMPSSTPNLAGPGAFFVPADALTAQDVEQRTSFRGITMSASEQQRTSVRGMEDPRIEQRPSFRMPEQTAIEQQSRQRDVPVKQGNILWGSSNATEPTLQRCSWDPDPTESSTNVDDIIDVEASIELGRGATTTPTSQARTSSVLLSRPANWNGRESVAYKRMPNDLEEDAEPAAPKNRQCTVPWWCSIVLPLIFLAAIVAVATVLVKSSKKEQDSFEKISIPSSAPMVYFFDDNTVPDFTLAALEDPKSPQSEAITWLLADPIATTFTQARKLQRFALATIYYSTNGARWKNSTHWLSDNHECTWFASHSNASICNEDEEYTVLALASNSMLGTLPAEISLLTSLEEISVGSNRIYGALPSQIGSLSKLSNLGLSQNELEGTIPTELAQLSDHLQILNLGENKLSGLVPIEIFLLSRLEELHLTDNALTSTIPTSLGKLDQLQTLRFGGNSLSGKIPSQVGLLTQLAMLNVGANELTGSLPSELGALSLLTFLGIAQLSLLQATLPTELAALTNLETLFATSSGISGSIPEQIGRMTSLRAISLVACHISGTLPTTLGRLTNAEWMYYYDNNELHGALPSELGLIASLKIFHGFVTQLDSTIPSQLGRLTELTELQLFDSMLTGELPPQLGNLSNLRELNIKNTELSGSFPESTCILSESQQLTITADCNQMECCKA